MDEMEIARRRTKKNIKREISADRRNTLAHILCYMLLNVYTTRKVKLNQNNREEEKKKKKTNSEKKKKVVTKHSQQSGYSMRARPNVVLRNSSELE